MQALIDNGELKEDRYHPKKEALHQKNSARLKAIIKDIGWPTISLVGSDASKATWLIALHAILDEAFMAQCLTLLEEAVSKHDVEPYCFAYLKDRTLTMQGKVLGLDTVAEAAERIQQRYQL